MVWTSWATGMFLYDYVFITCDYATANVGSGWHKSVLAFCSNLKDLRHKIFFFITLMLSAQFSNGSRISIMLAPYGICKCSDFPFCNVLVFCHEGTLISQEDNAKSMEDQFVSLRFNITFAPRMLLICLLHQGCLTWLIK
jgi:hypothetical protein